MAKLIDGRTHFNRSFVDHCRDHPDQSARGHLANQARQSGIELPEFSRVSEGPPLIARVNHGRWIVDCPDCQGAQFVWLEPPYLAMCPNCWNAMVGGRWRRIMVPTQYEEINAALAIRPLPFNRNWAPGESVADLWRENSEHGLLILPT